MHAGSVALQLDEGVARAIAEESTCNSEPCTTDQFQTMMRFVGPVCFMVLGGFGLTLMKVRVQGVESKAPTSSGDASVRQRSIDPLREQDDIAALEHADRRRRILDSI